MKNLTMQVTNPPETGSVTGWFIENLSEMMEARGYPIVGRNSYDDETSKSGVVLHPVPAYNARPYRRKSRAIFVIGIGELPAMPDNILATAYPLLIRTISNLFIMLVPGNTGQLQAHFMTLERGHYALDYSGDAISFFEQILDRIAPLATSHLVIENEFIPDLPEELWDGDAITASITRAGQRLAEMNLLPSVFPVNDLLSPSDLHHVMKLFSVGGLSYGNLSARKDSERFWMSASGVDKSKLRVIGQEILLVTGHNPKRQSIILSVHPQRTPKRVSVDAIEHYMIYREHPSVGAILHIHAWMDDIPSTEINYPCGTLELAEAVADLVRQQPDPGKAVIGLKNHGVTITGPSMDEIFARIEGRIIPQVPMS